MRLLLGDDEHVAAWAAGLIPHMHGRGFGDCRAIGVVSERGEPLAGVVFSNFLPQYRSIEISLATSTPRCLTRRLMQEIMAYPFEQLACQRVTAITPRRAAAIRRFIDGFGFKREGLVRRGFGDDDAVISGLLKREWLRSKWVGGVQEGRARGR